jgi:CheY-like chemotaxis protein
VTPSSAVVVAKEYVLMHDGNIGVVSSGIVGDGCIFYVDLKIAHSSEFDALSSVEGSNPSSSDVQKVDSHEPLTTGEVKPIVEDGIRSSGLPSNSINSTPSPDQSNHFFTLMSLSPKANPPTQSSSNLTPVAHPPPAKHSTKVIPGDSIIEGIKLSRALVVDDVASNRKMLGRVIQSRFHQIDYAENGKVAVDLVQESESNEGAIRFSVIFMDCNMPGDCNGADSCFPHPLLLQSWMASRQPKGLELLAFVEECLVSQGMLLAKTWRSFSRVA